MAALPSQSALKGRLSLTVKILGAKESAQNIREMTAGARRAFFEQMVEIAEAIKIRAQGYTPVLTGALRDSARVTAKQGRYPVVEIGFGGKAKDYAVIQHENLFYKHTVGQAKYLEIAVMDFEPRIQGALEVAVRHEISKHDLRGKFYVAGGFV